MPKAMESLERIKGQPLMSRARDILFRLHLAAFPPLCRNCGRWLRRPVEAPLESPVSAYPFLCPSCLADLPWQVEHSAPPPAGVDRVHAPFAYDQPVSRWIQRYKYEGAEELARMLGRLLAMAPGLGLSLGETDLVAPVPLHPRRLRWRGFNQALLLAHHMLGGVPLPHGNGGPVLAATLLSRSRHTRPQVEMDASERFWNVDGAFGLGPGVQATPERLRGLRVLLVDDVMTTGSTLSVCARVLKEAGASRVEALVLARA